MSVSGIRVFIPFALHFSRERERTKERERELRRRKRRRKKERKNEGETNTVSSLHINLQVANFQTCECAPEGQLYCTFQGPVL